MVLATEMSLKAVKSISSIVRWISGAYKSLLEGANIKEDVWWITKRVIGSIFEYYQAPARSTAAETSFDSDYQLQSTLI